MRVLERGNPAPFHHRRGPVGCLLLHGFPGSPAEMRLLGAYLAERGVSALAPLLPGHGTVPEDLRGVRWGDWVMATEAALEELRRGCTVVFVCGLSMGGVLALNLAARLPVAGVIALAPVIRVRDPRFELANLFSRIVVWVEPDDAPDDLADPQGRALSWHYRRYPTAAVRELLGLVRATRRLLRRIQAPTLMVQSPKDRFLDPAGFQWAYEQIPAVDKTMVWLERSGHNIAIDVEKEEVYRRTYQFIARLAGVGRAGAETA